VSPIETAAGTPGPGAAGTPVRRFAHEAMATVFEVLCVYDDAAYASQAAHAAFLLVDRLEQELSRFVPNSDVSRINDLAAGAFTRVGEATLDCLAIARAVFDATDGAFDVAIGTGLDRLALDPEGSAVYARAAGARLDLGGIGKGYAVDRMADLLQEWGIDRALVHGGRSSVVALDPAPGQDGWPLTFRAPWEGHERVLVRLSARRQALSASGTRKGGHIVDPRTGRAAERRAVWVALPAAARLGGTADVPPHPPLEASPATIAEGLSTALMILSVNDIRKLCARIPGVEAWLAQPPEGGESETPCLHLPGPSGAPK